MRNNGKALIEENEYSLKITVPAYRNYFLLLILIPWLGGWFLGFKSAFTDIIYFISNREKVDSFTVFWFSGWTVIGLFLIFSVLWGLFGKETLILSEPESLFCKTIFGIGIKRKLNSNHIGSFIFKERNTSFFVFPHRISIYGLGPGKIQFQYVIKKYSFGLALDDAEAQYIIRRIYEFIKY